MVSLKEATEIVQKALPKGKIQKNIEYKNLFVFQVFDDSPGEEELDPFYSVDKKTGAFAEFSLLTSGNIKEILDLFAKA